MEIYKLTTFLLTIELCDIINSQTEPVANVQDATVKNGENAVITCDYTLTGTRTFLAAQWYNSTSTGDRLNLLVNSALTNPNGRYAVDTTQPGVANLTIANTVLSDDGYYLCRIVDSPDAETGEHFGKLTVQYFESSSSLTIGVNNNITAQNVIITCSGTVGGNPVPDINLYRNSTLIKTQSTLPLTYTIATVSEDDGGIYRCEASNNIGNVTSNTITLHYYKPIFEQYTYTVGPGEKYVITADVNANPQEVTYVWSSDDVNDTDTNPTTFTFIASSVEDNTIYEISVIATNLIGSTSKTMWIAVSATNQIESTNSAKITIPSTEKTVEPCNSNIGLIIGMLFVGIIIGAVGFYIGQIIYNKIRKKSLAKKRDTDKRKQDTYMDYVGDAGEQNQTYQDLQHKVEESAYVNVKTGNKNRKWKV